MPELSEQQRLHSNRSFFRERKSSRKGHGGNASRRQRGGTLWGETKAHTSPGTPRTTIALTTATELHASRLARRGDLETGGNSIYPSIWSKLPCRGDLKEADTTSHSGSTHGFRSTRRGDCKTPPACGNDAEAISLFSSTAFLRALCVRRFLRVLYETTADPLLRRCAARAIPKSSPVQPQLKDLR
jgi:hypothetical protein